MPFRPARRMPGIRFEAQPPQLDEVLPRMDIAAFVGFAARGPVHVPVAVESAAEFEEIFGGDAPLAWDTRRGEVVHGRLAPAVRDFFRNGGSRCWAVRVAEQPSVNFFPIPGLARLRRMKQPDRADHLEVAPAFARARADGSWSDGLRVSSAIAPVPIEVLGFTRDNERVGIEATVASRDDLVPGDLLRLELTTNIVAMLTVEQLELVDGSPPSDRVRVRASGRAAWFRTTPPASLGSATPTAVVYTARRDPASVEETFASAAIPIINPLSDWTSAREAGSARLDLRIELEDAPEPGALVSVDAGAEQLWLSVRDVGVLGEDAGGTDRVRVTGRGLWWLPTAPGVLGSVARCDRLALELWVRRDDTQTLGLRDLGLAPGHPRYWAALEHDDRRYELSAQGSRLLPELARDRQFPLAGAGPGDAIYIPLDISLTPDRFLGAARQLRTALERDGLARFTPTLFLDPDLVAPLSESVLSEAGHLRYTAESPRRLKGIHAVLEIEEATILSVPDAPHRGWVRAPHDTPAPPQPSPPAPQPPWGTFLSCSTRALAQPQWAPRFQTALPFSSDSGTYTLEWEERAGDEVVVEEAHRADWSDATVIYSGADARLNIYGRPRGTYYYRVRAIAGSQTGDWSSGLVVIVAGAQAWHLADAQAYSADTLLVVHRALLRMAAARGDLFALLTLPEHYRVNEAVAHVALLKSGDAPAIPVSTDRPRAPISRPLGAAEAGAFSFGAVYHPWLILRDPPAAPTLGRIPPDGSMAGLLAHRALTRGAWIAPANEPLSGIVALSPQITDGERVPLLDAQVNVIHQESRGFFPISANTLSDDPDLGAINVRRLLSLLRRLALREGATYVFEPHDASFRRLVERGFESLLTQMFERGAFAGRTTASAFQVNTGTSLNSPRSVDQGRFIVELRVAPSRPMSFLTVRLVQSGDRTLVMEER